MSDKPKSAWRKCEDELPEVGAEVIAFDGRAFTARLNEAGT